MAYTFQDQSVTEIKDKVGTYDGTIESVANEKIFNEPYTGLRKIGCQSYPYSKTTGLIPVQTNWSLEVWFVYSSEGYFLTLTQGDIEGDIYVGGNDSIVSFHSQDSAKIITADMYVTDSLPSLDSKYFSGFLIEGGIYQLVVTKSSTIWTFYLQGDGVGTIQSKNSEGTPEPFPTPNTRFVFGVNHKENGAKTCGGDLIAAIMYNKTLSQEEIVSIYGSNDAKLKPIWYTNDEMGPFDIQEDTVEEVTLPLSQTGENTETPKLIIKLKSLDILTYYYSDGTEMDGVEGDEIDLGFTETFKVKTKTYIKEQNIIMDLYYIVNDVNYGTNFETEILKANLHLLPNDNPPKISAQTNNVYTSVSCSSAIELINDTYHVNEYSEDLWQTVTITEFINTNGYYYSTDTCSGEPLQASDTVDVTGNADDYSAVVYFKANNSDVTESSLKFQVNTEQAKQSNIQTVTNNINFPLDLDWQLSSNSFVEGSINTFTILVTDESNENNDYDWDLYLINIQESDVKSEFTGELQISKKGGDDFKELSLNDEITFPDNNEDTELTFYLTTTENTYGDWDLELELSKNGLTKNFQTTITVDNQPNPMEFEWLYTNTDDTNVTLGSTDDKVEIKAGENFDLYITLANLDHSHNYLEITSSNIQFKLSDEEEGKRNTEIILDNANMDEINKKLNPITVFIPSGEFPDDEKIDLKLETWSETATEKVEGTIELDIEGANSDAKDEGMSTALIGGIVGGVGALLLIAGILAFLLYKKKKREPELPPPPNFEPYIYGTALESVIEGNDREKLDKMQSLKDALLEEDLQLVRVLKESINSSDADPFCKSIVYIFEEADRSLELIKTFISDEIEKCEEKNALFRSNSFASKMMKNYSKLIGLPYLYRVLGKELFKINNELGYEVEVDVTRVDEDEEINVDVNKWFLAASAQSIFLDIIKSVDYCPMQFRIICNELAVRVEEKYQDAKHTAICGFIFLRVMCPAITTPEAYGLVQNVPNKHARRHLILVAKILQNVANGVNFKEGFMQSLSEFINENKDKAKKFFDDLSDLTPPKKDPKNESDESESSSSEDSEIEEIKNPQVEIPQIVIHSSLATIYRLIYHSQNTINNYLEGKGNEYDKTKVFLMELVDEVGEPIDKKVTKI
ncbi:ras gtpase-activating protein [Anaeramoeba flamelloides]|uniref:Ras gtpase-activating protein n=1 Tax=Anaeramoeba flamelloides TaxID=1746091 RepID=A0AAV8A142_9EUKA|nr:ras gtpase-activating protein [Anaeramoeba flamelloides]